MSGHDFDFGAFAVAAVFVAGLYIGGYQFARWCLRRVNRKF